MSRCHPHHILKVQSQAQTFTASGPLTACRKRGDAWSLTATEENVACPLAPWMRFVMSRTAFHAGTLPQGWLRCPAAAYAAAIAATTTSRWQQACLERQPHVRLAGQRASKEAVLDSREGCGHQHTRCSCNSCNNSNKMGHDKWPTNGCATTTAGHWVSSNTVAPEDGCLETATPGTHSSRCNFEMPRRTLDWNRYMYLYLWRMW